MDTALLQHALVYGLIMSAVLLVIVLASLLFNPFIGLKDYPPQVLKKGRKRQHPDTKQHRYWFGIPFILAAVTSVGIAISRIPQVTGHPLTFLDSFLTALIMLMVFNLADLLLVDLLLGMALRPAFMILPGTEGSPAYQDMGFYLKGFLTTSLTIVLLSVMFAAFAMAISSIA